MRRAKAGEAAAMADGVIAEVHAFLAPEAAVLPASASCRRHSWRLSLATRSALASELERSPRTLSVGSRSPAASSRADRELAPAVVRAITRMAYAAGVSGGAAAGGGRSEVKRRRAGASRVEPRTESPSEAAQPKGNPAQRLPLMSHVVPGNADDPAGMRMWRG
jgi:hypothetical protein